MMTWWMVGLMAAVVSLGLGWPVRGLLRRLNVIDRPGNRSSHQLPTVRGGGLGIIAVVLAGGLVLASKVGPLPVAWLLGSAVVLATVSFWDDLRSLGAAIRFGCHAAAAVAVLFSLGWPRWEISLGAQAGFTVPAGIALGVGFLWLAGYTNAFNFMDGINGIAGMQASVAGAGMALVAGTATGQWAAPPVLFSGLLAGATLGFLPHNFPRARMFMGDVGSAPLGFLLAATLLWLVRDLGAGLLVPLLLLHANFVLDTGITLARRIRRGEKWHQPHREHFYQRLVRAGRSHPSVTLTEFGLQLLVLLLVLAFPGAGAAGRVGLGVAVLAVWGLYFAYAESVFRQSPAGAAAQSTVNVT